MRRTKESVFEKIRDRLAGVDEGIKLADGFEEALIGEARGWFPSDRPGGLGGFGQRTVALYDYEKCVQILVKRDGMTGEEAREFLEFNTVGAYVGDGTPVFATARP